MRKKKKHPRLFCQDWTILNDKHGLSSLFVFTVYSIKAGDTVQKNSLGSDLVRTEKEGLLHQCLVEIGKTIGFIIFNRVAHFQWTMIMTSNTIHIRWRNIPKTVCVGCTGFVCMRVFDQGFLCVSSVVSSCHYLSQGSPLESEPGIRMGSRWEAGPGKDQCNLQSAFHTISVLDRLQESEREVHGEG